MKEIRERVSIIIFEIIERIASCIKRFRFYRQFDLYKFLTILYLFRSFVQFHIEQILFQKFLQSQLIPHS